LLKVVLILRPYGTITFNIEIKCVMRGRDSKEDSETLSKCAQVFG